MINNWQSKKHSLLLNKKVNEQEMTVYLLVAAVISKVLMVISMLILYYNLLIFWNWIFSFIQGSTFINRALALADTDMYTAASGDRPDVPDVLVVLTDGNQTPELKAQYPSLEDAAKKLRSRGITIVAVGVGDKLENNNLKAMATSENYLFTIGSYDDVFKLIFNVSATACGGIIVLLLCRLPILQEFIFGPRQITIHCL